jgi:HTH-type transcriptional regulator / antitoxin HipB
MNDVDQIIQERVEQSPEFGAMLENALTDLRIGEIIKELRQKKGITQSELARRLHTTKSAVSRLENRSGGARLETLEKVAQALDKELIIEFR